ncbi:membrane protein [Mycobacterium sp. 20KCMC460]|uniref:Membrane protein n=2 Tax=Mycobacteriaceae TaxID=1762 RepID=A0A9P3Q5Y8_9MYCO|nr:membrane protein [Mycobacterium sp. 20KCMC460]GLB82000.1 membrane protein [Mycobacterium kiyosense]GLD30251.1 membrane protein [Mycobacterium kiyosense]
MVDINVERMTNDLNVRMAGYSPAVLSLFRLVYGFLFAGYGSMILFGWPVASGHPVRVGDWPGWYAGLIEFVTGLLIGAGLCTRAAAFLASGTMAVAYFWMHQPNSLWPIGGPPDGNGGTPSILFCFGFFLLVFLGPGRYSLDALREAKTPRR